MVKIQFQVSNYLTIKCVECSWYLFKVDEFQNDFGFFI
jgi:hypothetical protein